MKIFAERLNEIRTDRGWSMCELARQINVPFQNISRWESGNSTPTAESIVKLATSLGVSADFLLGLKDEYY